MRNLGSVTSCFPLTQCLHTAPWPSNKTTLGELNCFSIQTKQSCPPPPFQVSNYLSFTKEDSDEEKKAEMAGVVSIGDRVYVKVCSYGVQGMV